MLGINKRSATACFLVILLVFLCLPLPLLAQKTQTLPYMRDDGVIYWETEGQKADDNALRYRTVSFMIHDERSCVDRAKSNCDPRRLSKRAEMNITQYKEEEIGGDQVRTYFKVPQDEVLAALKEAGIPAVNGNQVYLSSVFRIKQGVYGPFVTGKIYSLQEIKYPDYFESRGISWSQGAMDDFPQYYDIPLTMSFPPEEVHAVYKIAGGAVFQDIHIGDFLLDKTASHTFPKVVSDKQGNRMELVKTYITPLGNLSSVQNPSGPPNPTAQRSVVVKEGGHNIVGEYEIVGPPDPPPAESGGGEFMKPTTTAVVQADQRGAEQFEVRDGIPTTEDLYVDVRTHQYLYKYHFQEKTGIKEYTITYHKTYVIRETASNGSITTRTVNVSRPYKVFREYSYWLVDQLQVYSLDMAKVQNYALPNGGVVIEPTGYQAPQVVVKHSTAESDHIKDPVYNKNVTLPTSAVEGPDVPFEDWTSQAEAAIGKVIVMNDKLTFNGQTIMSDAETPQNGPKPGDLPKPPPMTGPNHLFVENQTILRTLLNRDDAPSTGSIHYERLPAVVSPPNNDQISFVIDNINPVTVHTPVVNFPSTSDDDAHNQMVVPTANMRSFILDRPFTITMPFSGQHRNIKGYGMKNYSKYMYDRQVQFPFDTMSADRSRFYPKNTWITMEGSETRTFFLPVWVDEGFHNVLFRTIAINSPPANMGTQQNANLNLDNYVATETLRVEVIGRLYDFRVTDVADYNWQYVFRQSDGRTPTNASYWVGNRGIDVGTTRTLPNSIYTLPIAPGKNPLAGMGNVGVKSGYHFKFEMKTKGNLFNWNDGIRIRPTFHFVSRDGTRRTPVHLYYNTYDRKFVRVGSPEDQLSRYTILNEPLRNVPPVEINQTAQYVYWHYFTDAERAAGRGQSSYVTRYVQNASNKTWIGNSTYMILPQSLRTFIGPTQVPAGVDAWRSLAAEQRWYGDYSIPAAPYVVDATVNLYNYARNGISDSDPIFLRDGYVVVNFVIDTIRNGNENAPHLSYTGSGQPGFRNQWVGEGYANGFRHPGGYWVNSTTGDVIFYHANQSSMDDFDPSGTH